MQGRWFAAGWALAGLVISAVAALYPALLVVLGAVAGLCFIIGLATWWRFRRVAHVTQSHVFSHSATAKGQTYFACSCGRNFPTIAALADHQALSHQAGLTPASAASVPRAAPVKLSHAAQDLGTHLELRATQDDLREERERVMRDIHERNLNDAAPFITGTVNRDYPTYECPICGEGLVGADRFNRHRQTMHPGEPLRGPIVNASVSNPPPPPARVPSPVVQSASISPSGALSVKRHNRHLTRACAREADELATPGNVSSTPLLTSSSQVLPSRRLDAGFERTPSVRSWMPVAIPCSAQSALDARVRARGRRTCDARQREFDAALDQLIAGTPFTAFGCGVRKNAFQAFLDASSDPLLGTIGT